VGFHLLSNHPETRHRRANFPFHSCRLDSKTTRLLFERRFALQRSAAERKTASARPHSVPVRGDQNTRVEYFSLGKNTIFSHILMTDYIMPYHCLIFATSGRNHGHIFSDVSRNMRFFDGIFHFRYQPYGVHRGLTVGFIVKKRGF